MESDKVIAIYKETNSIRATASKCGISPQTARRILITAGVDLVDSPRTEHICRLLADHSPEKVAALCGISTKTVCNYKPYTKGGYATGPKTENALRIAKSRNKQRSNNT